MSSTTRLTYNINSRNNDIDTNNSYYTYNNINQNYGNQNKDIIYQPQNSYENQNISLLNQTNPLPYNPVYLNDSNYINNSNINNISYNDNRFSRIHSRLDEINDKINKEKMEKENLIHSKITTTEMLLDNNNETRARKLREIKTSIRGLSLLFEQIKQFTKEKNMQSDEILENFENKFNGRLKAEQEKRKILEKRLKSAIDSKFKDMKCKLYDNSKERFTELENLKNKADAEVPQLKAVVEEERKNRKLKDEEIREKIKNKMNYYNDIMKKEIKNREIFDEKNLDDIKYSFADFNKQMRQNTFNREQSQGKLIDLVDATITQFEARKINNND
jgi:hypothetical protein